MTTESYQISDYSVSNIYKDEYNFGYSLLIDKVVPSDFDLVLVDDNGKTVGISRVHRIVLQVSSGYFSSLLASNMSETSTNSCIVRVPGLSVAEQCRALPRTIETFYSLQSNRPSTLQDLGSHLMMLDYFDFKGIVPYLKSFELKKSDSIPSWIQDMVINQLDGSSTDEAIHNASQALYSIVIVLDNMANSRKLAHSNPSSCLTAISQFRYHLFHHVMTILIIVWMAGIECLHAYKAILGETHRFCDLVLSVWCLDYTPNISHIANCLVSDAAGALTYAIEKTIKSQLETPFGAARQFCNELWSMVSRAAKIAYCAMQNITDEDANNRVSKPKNRPSNESMANTKLQTLKASISLDNNRPSDGIAFYSNGKMYTKMMEVLQISPTDAK